MKSKLIEYFLNFTKLTAEEISAIEESMVIKKYSKDSYLVKAGQHNRNTYFVLEGLVRQYKLINGEEISTNFFIEGQWIISLTSFSDDNISAENLICLEDTTVVIGNEQKAQELFKRFPRLETISRAVMETELSQQLKKLSTYQTDTPEQRYLKLLKNNPEIFQRVSQYQIASYIGVKPESLSRIRKRISKKDTTSI